MINSCGLANLGNTCYINTCIQLLTNVPIFNELINKKIECSQYNEKIIDKDILFQWKELQNKIHSNQPNISPINYIKYIHTLANIKKREIFTGFSQNDMPEFLQFIIETTHNSIARPIKMALEGTPKIYTDIVAIKCYNMLNTIFTKEYSEILDIFYGTMVSTIVSIKTKQVYNIIPQHFFILNLPVYDGKKLATTLYECLELYIKSEILEGENAWLNETTGQKENIIKLTHFWNFPPIVIITLNRYTSDGSQKINSMIQIPMDNLDLSKYVNGYDALKYKYELIGIGNHMGGVNGGHYNAFIKNENNEWFLYDDSNVAKVNNPENIISPSVYCLFYKIKK